MNRIDLNKILLDHKVDFLNKFPASLRSIIISLLSKILRLNDINRIIESCNNKSGIEFIDEVFEILDISYVVSSKDRLKIPSEGKLLIVSNHPLGGIDGLILLKIISEVREDVKILVNDVLLNIDNLRNHFLPVDLYSARPSREGVELIYKSLNNNEAIIIFPSGEVSRFGYKGIHDAKWKKSVVQISKKLKTPVLPVFINGRNSILFYLTAFFSKNLSMFLLPRELFNKKGEMFKVSIGHQIPNAAFENKYQKSEHQIKLLSKHTSLIGRGKSGIFEIEKNVIHPIPKRILRQQLYNSINLGYTSDKKLIFLVETFSSPDAIREIARLREITFRKVSEGTGKKMDTDKYDEYYKHIVLWDEQDLEIVGAYRIGIGRTIMPTLGINGFYTSELFNHSPRLESLLHNAAELGRSFIQSRYWNTSALDYLWQGLGVFLKNNPDIRYTFGGVSLSKAYSDEAKNHIVYFFRKWFGRETNLSEAKNRFTLSTTDSIDLQNIYTSLNYKEDLNNLKTVLKHLGYTVPTLYKQYAELCEQDGIEFIDFGIDPNFNNCVDALILVQIDKIKQAKKERYFSNNISRPSFAIA